MRGRQLLFFSTIALALAAALSLGDARPAAGAGAPDFTYGTLTTIANPTSLTLGPDGRLYIASQTTIRALTLDGAGTGVTATENVATGQAGVLGIAFDPAAPASPPVLYASRQNAAATDGYEGVISTYTGPTWTRADVITGLPSSAPFTNHFTNGIAFDPTGVLYIANGSNTDAGLQTPNYPETPLSAAILVADVNAPAFDGTIAYSPSGVPADDNVDQTGGDASVYAAGTRNPYDLVWHSNGSLYATDNGPNGPNTSATCTTTTSSGVAQNDELNRIVAGGYYGFPNRNRGRTDVRQCTYRSPLLGNGADYTAPVLTLPAHCSCDGIAEYTAPFFGMQGDLLIAQLVLGSILRVELSADGQSVVASSTLRSGLSGPLDVAVGPSGVIYIAEFNGGRISYLAPVAKPVGGVSELAPSVAAEGRSSAVPLALAAGGGLAALALAGVLARRRRSMS